MKTTLAHSDAASEIWHHTIAPSVIVVEQFWHRTGERHFTLKSFHFEKYHEQNPIIQFENVNANN